MARGFLDGRDRSSGTLTSSSSDTTGVRTMTPGGGGTKRGEGTSRSIPRRRRSTGSSATGAKGSTGPTASTDAITRSIHEQITTFRYKSTSPPRFIVMSPRTRYDYTVTSPSDSALFYPEAGVMKMFGLEVITADWMPDGIAIVTDTYEEDVPGTFYLGGKRGGKKMGWDLTGVVDASIFSTSKTYSTSTASGTFFPFTADDYSKIFGSYKTTADFKISLEDASKTIPAWDDPVIEDQEPDPDSLYGKALARARAAKHE